MEGTSGADDLKRRLRRIGLLQKEQKIIALFFSSNGFLEAGSRRHRDYLLYIRVSLRRILGAMEGMNHRLLVISE